MRVKGIIPTAVGIAFLAYTGYAASTRYSNERIWKNQRMLIEKIKDPKEKQETYDRLRNELMKFELSERRASTEERCRFNKHFTELLVNKGNEKAAEKKIATESYEPYAHCKTIEQVKSAAKTDTGIVSIIALAYGLIRILTTAFRKRENQ